MNGLSRYQSGFPRAISCLFSLILSIDKSNGMSRMGNRMILSIEFATAAYRVCSYVWTGRLLPQLMEVPGSPNYNLHRSGTRYLVDKWESNVAAGRLCEIANPSVYPTFVISPAQHAVHSSIFPLPGSSRACRLQLFPCKDLPSLYPETFSHSIFCRVIGNCLRRPLKAPSAMRTNARFNSSW